MFDELKARLAGSSKTPAYSILAERLGSTEAAVKMTIKRMRHRYGELLREEIANAVGSPVEMEDELRHLFAVLGEK